MGKVENILSNFKYILYTLFALMNGIVCERMLPEFHILTMEKFKYFMLAKF
jgi:hypothetical protein